LVEGQYHKMNLAV